MFIRLVFLCTIPFVFSFISQEDLLITKYSHIGCLILKPNKQYIVNTIQENYLIPYQTFSSSYMTIELCFRLCRRWTILLYNNQTNCICLYTINKLYEMNEYLGEFISKNPCESNHVEIYSLTGDISIFPSLLISPSDDWSLDGCYSLNNIQRARVNLRLPNIDFNQAIDLCRKHCQTVHQLNSYSYFLSRKKSCYCLPLDLSQKTQIIALRKPLSHCSFLPYICQGFSMKCENYYYDTELDTLIKIDVKHYCSSSNEFFSFIFDQIFYVCLKSVLLSTEMDFSTINYDQKCLPLLIKTFEQWNYLIHSSWITYSKLFISIDQNSTFIFNQLLKMNNQTVVTNDLCMVIYRTETNNISYEFIPCSGVQSSGYVLCTQKPLPAMSSDEDQLQIIKDPSDVSTNEILSCPPEFILFNKMCYNIHLSFIYDVQLGERLCYTLNSNSTLVKFDSHEWGNINPTKFVGRTYEDILLEFFYYYLEKKLFDATNRKYKLRILIGDSNVPNECVLRYFEHESGAFKILYACNNGGHPICQTEPFRTKIPSINQTNINQNNYSSLIESTTQTIILNSTDLSSTILPVHCENCTINSQINEDLLNNKTIIDAESTNNTLVNMNNVQSKIKKLFIYRPLILILTGPVLALIILLTGIGLLIRHLRQHPASYSARSSIVDHRRTKRSSTTVTLSDIQTTPGVLYNRLKTPRISINENDTFFNLDNSLSPNDDNSIEMVPATRVQLINKDENQIKEDDEEQAFYLK